MSDELTPAPADRDIVPVDVGGNENFNSPTAAAKALADWRYQKNKEKEGAEEKATPAPEESGEPSAPTDATPPQEVTGETQEVEPETPLDLPRSWAKDRREAWSKLDHALQQYLLDHDREASTAVRKAQNEAAEARRAIEAERAKVEQARQHYEAALPQLMQALDAQYLGEFADIKTPADVERLAREDPYRYSQWDFQNKKRAAVQQEMANSQQRAVAEYKQKFDEFARKQDALFNEHVPEMADPTKAAELRTSALKTLEALEFTNDELGKSWEGQLGFSLRDNRVQRLIRDATLWREAQAKAKVASTKPVPPVQRPGVSKSPNSQAEAEIQTLQQRLAKTGNIRDAIALRRAQQAAAR